MYNEGLFKNNSLKRKTTHTKKIYKQYIEIETYTENTDFYDCIIVTKKNGTIKCCEFYNCIIRDWSGCVNITSCSLNSCDLRHSSSYYNWCSIDECIIGDYANICNSKVCDSILHCKVINSLITICHIKSLNIKDCYEYRNSYEGNCYINREIMSLNGKIYNVGYKKAKRTHNGYEYSVIIKLLFNPEKSGCTGGDTKRRTSSVYVLDIYSIDKKTHYKDAYSGFDNNFEYKKGSWISEPSTNMNSLNTCSTGIHFFFSEADAIEYCL